MKRGRDENTDGPQLKRPSNARPSETSGSAHPAGSSQRLTTDDALAYLKAVKDMFKDQKEKYDEFLEVMKDFKAQRLDTAGVITKVKDLFKGHRDLILGFNSFLPKGYEISLPPEEDLPPKRQPVEFDQAISYVNKIKNRFRQNEQVYKAFLEVLNLYRRGNKSITEVYQEVAALFLDHRDLLDEFTHFLPESTGVAHLLPPPKASTATSSGVRREEKIPGLAMARHMPGEKPVKKEKTTSIQADRDWNSERPMDRDQERVLVKGGGEKEHHRKRVEKEKERKDEGERKEREKADRMLEQERDKDADNCFPQKRKSNRKQYQVGEAAGETLAGSAPTSSLDEKKVPKIFQRELAFFERAKGRLRNSDTYMGFLKLLNMYSEEIIDRSRLQNMVAELLAEYPDLIEGFNSFLLHCENSEEILVNFVCRKFPLSEGPLMKQAKSEKERDKEKEKEDKEREKEKEKDKERERDKEKERELEKEREKEREKEKFSSGIPKDSTSHKISMIPAKDTKFLNKPVSELDLSNCERCSPSYRLLPKNYPKPIASHRTDLGYIVLNDNWVSVTSGSEDYSFKHMRKNQYEESLFRCEDDRFELDMLLESTAATAKRLEGLLEKANGKLDSQTRIEDHLTAINLRCIERVYGDHGLDAIDLLRKNFGVAVPVILGRLKQKQDEWTKCKSEMNKVWAEVYAKNYYKSLDHRSFYFKQQDKKNLSTKGLLAEVKEINERKRFEDDVILSLAAGHRRSSIPDLKFNYPDSAIFEDMYQIIKYSADEMCTTMEQSDKIMRLWTSFLEPIFGVPTRSHGVEDAEEFAKIIKAPGEVIGASDASDENNGHLSLTAAKTKLENTSLADEPPVVILEEMKKTDGIVITKKACSQILLNYDSHVDGFDRECRTEVTLTGKKSRQDMQGDSKLLVGFDGLKEENNSKLSSMPEVASLKLSSDAGRGITRANSTGSDGGLESSSKEQPFLPSEFQNVETRIAGVRKDEKVPELRLDSPLSSGNGKESALHSTQTVKIEREEGELSPSPELEDRENADYNGGGDDVVALRMEEVSRKSLKNVALGKGFGRRMREEEDPECDGDLEGEQDADADDEGESAQKVSEESENGSEAGEEVSGSESGDVDECFREENEEDEDEGKVESEGEAEGMADAEGDATSLASSDRYLLTCRPLGAHGPSLDPTYSVGDSKIFYGDDTFYVLFRLHQALYERILSAKTNAITAEHKWKTTKDTSPPDLYARFMRALYNLLDGSADNAKFEDDCRAIIGTQSYVLFTLDKLIFKIVKQLQAIISDDMANKLLALHCYEKSHMPGSLIDTVYYANSSVILFGETIYRFENSLNPNELRVQLMEGGSEKLEVPPNAMDSSFSRYLNDFFLLSSLPDTKARHPVFLARNLYVAGCDNGEEFTMKDVRVVNGLEHKISCSTSKVSYVLDTEDFLHRRKWKRQGGRPESSAASSERASRFRKWADEQIRSSNPDWYN